MAAFKSSFVVAGIVGGILGTVLLTRPASSSPSVPTESLDQLYQRIVTLEERSDVLQRQVDYLQRQVHSLQRSSQTQATLEANGWLERSDGECVEPFFRDKAGFLRVRQDCLSAPASNKQQNRQ